MTVVTITDTRLGLQESFEDIFHPYGGLKTLIPDIKTKIFLKPNGIHFTAKSYTDPAMIEGLIVYLKNLGYKRLALMEGSTGGNFTRLVFKICGYEDLCKKHNVEMIYLDEGPTVEVALRDGTKTRVSRRLWRNVINREGSFYFDLPKLKTHSMATLTLGVKNQQAFPIAGDRMQQHNHETLHMRLAALYALTKPDFCIIEGIDAVYHGHVPIEAFLGEQVARLNILIGGQDTLAVDVVGARVLGYTLNEVEHLRLCAKWNLGESDINNIQIKGVSISTFTKKYPNTLLGRFHPDVQWVVGRTARVWKAAGATPKPSSRCSPTITMARVAGRSWSAADFLNPTLIICTVISLLLVLVQSRKFPSIYGIATAAKRSIQSTSITT